MMNITGEEFTTLAINIGLAVATFLLNTGFALQAILLCEEYLILLNNGDLGNESTVTKVYRQRILILKKKAGFTVYNSTSFEQLLLYHKVVKTISKTTGNAQGEALCYKNLGLLFQLLGQHNQAQENLEKALAISIEIADRIGVASCYINLGS